MKKPNSNIRRTAAAAAMSCLGLLASAAVHAENHALIMWIGDYADSRNNLKGIDLDAMYAKEMAALMGVPSTNIRELKNNQATLAGMSNALRGLTGRIKKDDKVFIYYSGHGYQFNKTGGQSGCSEGLVAYEAGIYHDEALRNDLDNLASKASQVIMFNDSCFSGGAATKSLDLDAENQTKAYQGEVKSGSASDPGYVCNSAVNKMARDLEIVGKQRGANVFYLAASADNEVAFPSPRGSLATLAWSACMKDPATDTDRSGMITGEELAICSKRWMKSNSSKQQTITAHLNSQLPMSFARPTSTGSVQRIDPSRALHDMAARSDPSYRVTLTPASNTMRIKQDYLDFTVNTNKAGYLYVFQVGSSKKAFTMLYPNKFDKNNYMNAGSSRRLPGDAWKIRSGGPAGTSHLMAYISPTEKNFAKDMDPNAAFGEVETDDKSAKDLFTEASDNRVGDTAKPAAVTRYGTSAVVAIREIN